jgi:large conductance mechanosensitive channel
MGMIQEFKEFAMKGNLIDMAVGVVMGAAFGKVSGAFIDGMFMPLVGKIFQVGDLSKYKMVLTEEVKDAAGKVITPESAIATGEFLGAILNFVIVAAVMFMVIKAINKMKKAEETAPAVPTPPPAQEVLLAEIRDLLKK